MVRFPHLVRPALLVAPGFALLAACYSLDYPYPDSGAFPAHVWSAVGAVAGWLLLLAALVLINPSPLIRWIALFSALAVGAVSLDSHGQVSRDSSTWIGVVGSCLVFVIVGASTLVNVFGQQRARVYSFIACAIGIGAFGLNSLYPQSPMWNGPPALLFAALVITPVFVLLRRPYFWSKRVDIQPPDKAETANTTSQSAFDSALFKGAIFGQEASTTPTFDGMRTSNQLTAQDKARFGPPKSFWLAGCRWGWIYFFVFAWSFNEVAQLLRRVGAKEVVAYGGAILVVIVVWAGIAILGPWINIRLQPWLDVTIGDWERLDTRALALQKSAKVDAPTDENLAKAEVVYLRALEVAETGERPLLIATASNNLASLYAQEGRMAEAIRLFERALQLRMAYAGENSEATRNSIQRLEAARQALPFPSHSSPSMSAGSKPEGQGDQSMHLDEMGVWMSRDGTWKWDGANWVPRGGNNDWLGDLIGFRKRDLDANRSGRLSFGQAAGLWLWAAIWLVLGTLLVGIALVSALPESFWLRVFVAPIVFTIAVYLCWRGFATAADAVSGGVAFTSGALSRRWESDDDAPWAGAGYYYVGVGGVEKKVYKGVGERVPLGVHCRVYYSATSKRLLSIDTAPSGDMQAFAPSLRTWARVRWGGISAIVGIFVLVAGIIYVVTGDPTRRVDSSVAGVLSLVIASILLGASIFRLVRTVRGRSTS